MKNNYAMNVSSLGKTLTALAILTVVSVLFPFTTQAQILVTQTESVEGTIFPAPGWKMIKGPNNPATNVSTFSRVAAASAVNPACGAAPGGGTNITMFNSFSAGTNDDYYMISKPFDFSNNSGNNPVFSFWMYRDAGSAGVNDKIEVFWNNTPTTTAMVAINHAGGVNFINRPIASFPTVAAAGWYQYTFTLPAATYNGKRNYFVLHGVSQFGQNIYLDNFVCNTYPTAMSPGDVTFDLVQQNQSTTSQGATNQWILGVRCVVGGTSGCGNLTGPLPVKLDSLLFNTNGTSNVADIVNAKVYYTGGSNLFSNGYVSPFPTAGLPANTSYPKTQFGTTLSAIGTNIDFTNAAASCFFLEYDTTYFWITYDISATAPGNNYLDADFRGAAVGGTALTCPSPGGTSSALLPATFTLDGAVQVDIPYCVPTYTVGTAWAGYTNNDYVQSVQLVGYGGTNINTTTNAVSLQLPSLPCYPNCRFVKHPPDYEYRSPSVPNQAVTLQQGAAYSITVQAGTWFSSNYIRAWIDYNHNGTFEATEILGTANLAANAFQTFPFVVPAAGYTGNTRLRVREVFATSNPDPCANYTYGECEDFVVTLIPNCSPLYKLWLGNNNDWNNSANWCPSIPTINDDVVINKALTGTANYYNPVIKSGVLATCKNISIAVTDTLTIDAPNPSAASFKAKGTVTNNGQIRFTTSYTPTITVSTGTLLNFTQTPLPGKTYKAGQTQIIYTAAELAGYGMLAGDQITAIKLNVKNNDLVTPTRTYNNFSISYLNSAAVFNAYANTTAIAGAFTTVYSNAAQPIVFGVNTLTLGSPITWDGVNNICLQYCYTNVGTTGSTNNDYIDVTQTTGRNSTLILGRLVASAAGAPAACSFVAPVAGDITANGATTASPLINILSQFRPNATFVLSRPYGKPKVVVQGSWVNNNSFLAGTSSFVMDSYKSNRIGGTQPTTFYTFTMSKVTATNATVTSALGNGTSITYSAAGHTYSAGQLVEVTGLTPAGYNASGTISSVVAGVSFTIAGIQTGASSGTGVASVETATASNARPIYLDQDITIQDTFYLTAGQMIMNGKTLTMTNPRPSAFWRTQLTQASGTPAGVGTGFLISENAASVVNWNVGAYAAPTSARAIPFGNRIDTVSAAITYMPVTFLHKAGDLGTFKAATKYWAANAPITDPPTVTHIDTYNNPTAGSGAATTTDRYWMIGKTGPQNPAVNYPVVDLTFRFSNIAAPAIERPAGMSGIVPGKAQPWRAASLQWMRISANATLNVYTIPVGGVNANGTTITYTTSVAHQIVAGQAVTMTGITPAAYNIVGGIVTSVTATTFTIANPTSVGPSTVAGTVTGSPAAGATNYNVQQTTLNYVQSYTQVVGTLDSVRITSWDWPTAPAQGLPYSYPAAPIGDFTPWTISNNNTPLPIDLVDFKAKAEGKRVRLDWTTASEIDNDYFTVERSTDAKDYSYIDRVNSYMHNSNIMLNYTTYDEHPVYGLQYYRLKQTDFNGEFTYSEPRAVWFGSRAPFDITNVYGEASASNDINVDFMYNSNEPVTVVITDVTGKLLYKEDNVAATKGENSIKLNSSLPHGLYFITLKNSEDVVSRKFVY